LIDYIYLLILKLFLFLLLNICFVNTCYPTSYNKIPITTTIKTTISTIKTSTKTTLSTKTSTTIKTTSKTTKSPLVCCKNIKQINSTTFHNGKLINNNLNCFNKVKIKCFNSLFNQQKYQLAILDASGKNFLIINNTKQINIKINCLNIRKELKENSVQCILAKKGNYF
ncbi:hypothetical protein Mgra_00002729, partial [Meloidogyne graminicola]